MTRTSDFMFDIIVRGGTVIDGTRKPRFDADVGILDGKIAAVGDLSRVTAPKSLEVGGKVVAPGFIDSHTHDGLACNCAQYLRWDSGLLLAREVCRCQASNSSGDAQRFGCSVDGASDVSEVW